jgi:transposase
MHEIGTVRAALILGELQDYRNTVEAFTVRGSTLLDIPHQEQEWMLAELRHARRGCLLTLHVLLLCAAGRTPTEIATFLFCSRTSVYRIVNAYHPQWRDAPCDPSLPAVGGLTPSVRRSLLALLRKAPAVYGWCRTRWSCATLAAQLHRQRGVLISASTMRRWLHALGWVWKRAQLVARDDDPQRVEKLARIRYVLQTLDKRAVVLFADELDIHLLPKVGYQWLPRGTTVKLVTPGQNQKRYLAGALEPQSGRLLYCTSLRKTNALFRTLLDQLEELYPQARFTKVSVVVDNSGIHKAKAVERWLAAHPRFELLFLPTYCPKANPIKEHPTDYTWSAPQAQPSAGHLPSPPFDRPNGRGYTTLPQGGPSLLGYRTA